MKVNGMEASAGCYVAGHYGQYASDELAAVCEQFEIDFDPDDDPRYWRRAAEAETMEDAAIISSGGFQRIASPEDCWERHHGAADNLLDMLNDLTTGGYWEWSDGELFLIQTEVEGTIYIVAKDYEEAWEILRDGGSQAGYYCESEPALEYADDEGLKVFQFRATIHYEPEE